MLKKAEPRNLDPIYKCQRCKDVGVIIWRKLKIAEWYKEFRHHGKVFNLDEHGDVKEIQCPACSRNKKAI